MRGRRTRIATGIYRDPHGFAVIISLQGKPKEFRYPSDTATATLISERLKLRASAALARERRAAASDTFEMDVPRFLDTLTGDGHRLNMQGYMAHWVKAFGDRPRNEITDVDAQTAFAQIKKADSTRRHLRRALIRFYETLNGVSGYNPARALAAPPKPKAEARALPYAWIERIFAALQPSRARARLKLIAYVGLPQHLIAQLQPSDLRLSTRELIVHPRRKGAGVEGRALPLSDAGIKALEEFQQLNAFGTFQLHQLVTTFRLGAKRAQITLPENARPYDLRHSFLTELYRQTGDLYAVSELGMHATLEQTARYAKGAISERATKAIAAVPRFSGMAPVQSPTKRSRRLHRNGSTKARKRPKK